MLMQVDLVTQPENYIPTLGHVCSTHSLLLVEVLVNPLQVVDVGPGIEAGAGEVCGRITTVVVVDNSKYFSTLQMM